MCDSGEIIHETEMTKSLCTYIDDNALAGLETNSNGSLGPALHKLRVLRLSGNRITRLDVSPFPNLRTLYIDSNRLAEKRYEDDETITGSDAPRLLNLQRLTKLENFSARHQRAEGGRASGLWVYSFMHHRTHPDAML